MTTPTFEHVTNVLAEPMGRLLPRWIDEHRYERAEFVNFFRPLVESLGWTLVDVRGNAKALILLVATKSGAQAEITMKRNARSEAFSLKAVR